MPAAAAATEPARQLKMPPVRLAAPEAPSSFDAKARTLKLELLREGFTFEHWAPEIGSFMCRFSFDPAAIESGYLDAGLSVVHEHGWGSRMENPLLGRCDKDWKVEGTAPSRVLALTARLTQREDETTKGVVKDIETGILKSLSAGVRVIELMETAEARDGLVVYLATKWQPFEATFCAVPRDPNAAALSRQSDDNGVATVVQLTSRNGSNGGGQSTRGNAMPDVKKDAAAGGEGAGGGAPAGDGNGGTPAGGGVAMLTRADHERAVETAKSAAEATARESERKRVAAIVALSRQHALPAATEQQLLDDGSTLDRAREVALAHVSATKGAGLPTTGSFAGGESEVEKVSKAIEAAYLVRGKLLRGEKAQADAVALAKPLLGRRQADWARLLLARAGKGIGAIGDIDAKSDEEVVRLSLSRSVHLSFGGMGVSDLPNILANVATKAVMFGYDAVMPTFRAIARTKRVSDFKQITAAAIGLGPSMQVRLAGEPIKYGKITDHAETPTPVNYSTGTQFTKESIVNDDLDAIDTFKGYGIEAQLLPNRICWAIIKANAAMKDGVAVFHSTHANEVAAPSAFAKAGVAALRKLGRLQTEPDGKLMGLMLDTIVVPANLEVAGLELTTQISAPNGVAAVNVFGGTKLLVEGELDSMPTNGPFAYYGASSLIPTFGVWFVNSEGEPTIETEVDFDTKAVKATCELAFAACVLTHRAIYRNLATS